MEGLSPNPEVVVLGCAGVDTNVFLPRREVDWGVEANFTDNLDTPGQAGVYASRGYGALGRRVAFIGNLGDDACGTLVREVFSRDGVDVRGVFTDPAGTARSVNVMYPDGRRKNFYDARANSGLCPAPARCREVMAGAKLAHVHLADWARRLLAESIRRGQLAARHCCTLRGTSEGLISA